MKAEKKHARRETVYEQGMLMPWVNYPGEHWPWITFSETAGGQPHFCACMRPAVAAFLKWNDEQGTFALRPGCTDRVNHFFFGPLLQRSELRLQSNAEVETSPLFREACCHLCAGHMPSRLFPLSSILDGHFGWYVKLEVIAATGDMFERESGPLRRARARVCLRLGLIDQEQIDNEDALAITVRGVCGPREELRRNARPEWLEGLELDVLLPGRRLGVEYQGAQHVEPVEYFGGERALAVRLDNDERKRALCAANGVALEYFDTADPLTEEHVRERLAAHFGQGEHPAEWPPIKLRPEGPEWAALSPTQQLDTLVQIYLTEQMEHWAGRTGYSLELATNTVRALYDSRYAAMQMRKPGVEPASLQRKLYRARKLGGARRWQDFCRYKGLLKERVDALREQGLSINVAKSIIRINGGAKTWGKAQGFNEAKIVALVRGRMVEPVVARKIAFALGRAVANYRQLKQDEVLRVRGEIMRRQKRLKQITEELRIVNADLLL